MPSIMQRIGTPHNRHNKDLKYRSQLENVDPELSQYNEVLNEKSITEIYQEYLQPAFDAYNAKQKRKDRRLDVKWGCNTALEYQRAMDVKARASKNAIDQKGRPPIREIVWQFGNPQQGFGCKDQTAESRALAKTLLAECAERAKKRYPNFAWGDEVFHADEVSESADSQDHGSFHLHQSFVPLCYQNKQGPSVQVAMERCLKEMGFDTFQAWKHDLDTLMEEVLQEHGLERTLMDNHEKHQESSEFHRQQRVIKETRTLERKKEAAEIEVQALEARGRELNKQMDKAAEWMSQIPGWPEYEEETKKAVGLVEEFKNALREFFSSGWIFRNRKGERRLLDAVERFRDKIMVSLSALKGFEVSQRVPEQHQRSRTIEKSLDELIRGADEVRPKKALGRGKEDEIEL